MSQTNPPGFNIPRYWAWSTLGAIAEIKGGITKDQKREVHEGRLVPYLRVANVQRGYLDLSEMKEIEATEEIINELRLQSGDLLFTEGGDRDKLGRGWVWRGELPECIHQNHIFRARLLDAGISPKLVSWFSNAFGQPYFIKEGKQTTNLASVNLTKLKAFPFPVPPAEEQERLIAKVEELLSKLDAGVEALKKARALLKRYRASVLKAACEGRLVPSEAALARQEGRAYEPAGQLLARILKERRAAWGAAELAKMARKGIKPKNDAWKKKYQEPAASETEGLPELPEGWVWATWDQLGEWSGGGTPSKRVNAFWENGTVPWISPKDVKSLFLVSSEDKITNAAIDNSATKMIPPGSLLFVVRSGILRRTLPVALTMMESTLNQDLKALSPVHDINPNYLLFIALAHEGEIRTSCAKDGTTVESIEFEALRQYRVPIAPVSEQNRIVEELQRLFSIIDQIDSNIPVQLSRSNRLRQAILKNAFEGKLVPQDPNDEPASVLLERIKAARAQAAQSKPTRARRATRRS